jgi:hypothetical protein
MSSPVAGFILLNRGGLSVISVLIILKNYSYGIFFCFWKKFFTYSRKKLQSKITEEENEITREEKSFEFGSTKRIYEIARILQGAISSKAPEEKPQKKLKTCIKSYQMK